MDDFKNQLRKTYKSIHSETVSSSVYSNLSSLWPYFEVNYKHLFCNLKKDSQILEIGVGSGAFLAWLKHNAFSNLVGVDVAEEEVKIAQQKQLPVILQDAVEYLHRLPDGSLDVVVLKAVLEHMPKDVGANLLKEISRVLKTTGFVLVDVPNMDWLLASHERYMDLTHETGYTVESLRQVLRMYFKQVVISGSLEPVTSKASFIRIKLLRPVMIKLLRLCLRIFGEGASSILFSSRSIIAVGRKEASLHT